MMKPRKKKHMTRFYTMSEMHKHDMAKSKNAAIEQIIILFQNVNKITKKICLFVLVLGRAHLFNHSISNEWKTTTEN